MKLTILVILSMISISCGYTRISDNETVELPKGPLPDLIITSVSWQASSRVGNGRVYPPLRYSCIDFYLKVANIGKAPYEGPVYIAWGSRKNDFELDDYEGMQAAILQPKIIAANDTAEVVISVDGFLKDLRKRYRFLIATQQVMPNSRFNFTAVHPVQESRLDNNGYEYVVQ